MKERVVYCPVGNEFTPCDPAEVQPIVAHLKENQPVAEQLVFTRGSHLPDGRVDLCKQCVGPEGTRLVADAVKENAHTRHLLMGANGMGNAGAQALAELIRENESLQTIYLGCNRIDETGTAALAQAISDSPSIRALWLKRNPIGTAGARQIAEMLKRNPRLRTLDLVHTKLGSKGVRLIARTLTSYESAVRLLYLGGNEIQAEDADVLAELVQQNQRLSGLYLSVNQLGEAGAVTLADGLRSNQGLRSLSLASNRIGPEGTAALAAALESHPGLIELDLGYDRSTRVLGEEPNNLGDAGAAQIARLIQINRRLRSVDLTRNQITDRGARLLIAALEQNPALINLSIGKGMSSPLRSRLHELLERNRKQQPDQPEVDEDIRAIRSIYRTLKK
ncbi:Leucine Rich repeats (2 copies) [Gimesia panareensis]|uniref:Leucine Rich repeats (2 copies) n=1 Tax=Gimesia panareensis TaxID=2527978 RepID=A0A518FS66_9PLAN|nr:ribonuclease inhibitor [Gimesia panareensis]QDV19189.1 Leucine Rich repeats (2 copies) [Gimesia panareensis]